MKQEIDISAADINYVRDGIRKRYSNLLERYHLDVDDMVQATLEQAVRSWFTFQGRSSRRTWLTRITMNVVLMACRFNKKRGHDIPSGLDPERCSYTAFDMETRYAAHEELFLYGQAMSSAQFDTLLLQHAYGYTQGEIGAMRGIEEQTVGSRIFYAREKLETARSHLSL